jgi:hypothetical protein
MHLCICATFGNRGGNLRLGMVRRYDRRDNRGGFAKAITLGIGHSPHDIGLCPQTEMSSSPAWLSICSNPARFRYSCNSCGVEQTVM